MRDLRHGAGDDEHHVGHDLHEGRDERQLDARRLDGLVLLQDGDQPDGRGAQEARVAQIERHERQAPRGTGRHEVGVRGGDHHEHGNREGRPGQRLGNGLAASKDHEPCDDDDGQRHASDELLGDARRDVPEAVEDALPVLEVQEGSDAAYHQRDGGRDERGHLQVPALALERQDGHAAQRAAGQAYEQREDDERPLRFHYSSPPSQ